MVLVRDSSRPRVRIDGDYGDDDKHSLTLNGPSQALAKKSELVQTTLL